MRIAVILSILVMTGSFHPAYSCTPSPGQPRIDIMGRPFNMNEATHVLVGKLSFSKADGNILQVEKDIKGNFKEKIFKIPNGVLSCTSRVGTGQTLLFIEFPVQEEVKRRCEPSAEKRPIEEEHKVRVFCGMNMYSHMGFIVLQDVDGTPVKENIEALYQSTGYNFSEEK